MRLVGPLALAGTLALALTCASPPKLARAQGGPAVEGAASLQSKARERGRVHVIARLRGAQAESANGVAEARDRLAGVMAAVGVDRVRPLGRFPLVAMELDPQQLEALLASGLVDAVQEDADDPPTLAESVPIVGGPAARAAGATGTGWTVAVLDTGVDRNHPFLAGRVAAEACFSTSEPALGRRGVCPNGLNQQFGVGAGAPCTGAVESCRHGTHVAGIAAGRGTSFSGMAPAAEVVAIQVFRESTGADGLPVIGAAVSDQILALDHVLTLSATRRIAAVNMSLGGGRFGSPCDTDLRKVAIDRLRAAGVATVIASGNDGYSGFVGAPGCISTATTVGATTDYGAETLAGFSNTSGLVDLLAPGEFIDSSVPGGGFATLRGTSMATPHVAGTFAALRSRVGAGTGVAVLEQALAATGRLVLDPDAGISYRSHELVTAAGSHGKAVGERSLPGSARSAFQAAQAASRTAS